MSVLRIDAPVSTRPELLSVSQSTRRGTEAANGAAKELLLVQRGTAGFAQSGFAIDRTEAVTRQETDRFIQVNRDLLRVIDRDDSGRAMGILERREIASRKDLQAVIAETAHALLTPNVQMDLTVEKLTDRPNLSALLVLNTGGLRDLINERPGVQSLFSAEGAAPEKAIYEQVALKAAALFEEGAVLDDPEFFLERPKVAEFLLGNRDVVRDLNYSATATSSQTSFRYYVDREGSEALFETYVSGRAAELANSGAFSAEFFSNEDNVPFAEFVAGGEFVPEIPPAAQYLNEHPNLRLENKGVGDQFNFPGVMRDLVALQARNLFQKGSPLSIDFFRENIEVARLAITNQSFREQLGGSSSETDLKLVLSAGRGTSFQLSNEVAEIVSRRFRPTFSNPRTDISIIA